MTNALKMILLGAIASYEEGRCFFIDESDSQLVLKNGDQKNSLIKRYFEPMGLNPNSIIVQKAIFEGRVETKDWTTVWGKLDKRRVQSSQQFIQYLANQQINGHRLKFISLMKMWRPLMLVRNTACLALEKQGLNDEFMAFSVRRGDKHELEKFDYPSADEYIAAAERNIPIHFGGVVPKIFVATDDCVVMGEFRSRRPAWTFVSQCDLPQNTDDRGFALADMKDWSTLDTDQHYEKFMTELFGLAISKYVVGVTYTNVSWWILFMRRANADGMEFIGKRSVETNNW